MLDFNKLYKEYKLYLESNSQYGVKVVKHYNYDKSQFPIIDFSYDDSVNTYNATVEGMEYYDREYFIITIYTTDQNGVSKQVIADELKYLTQKFIGRYKGMTRTSCKPIPNADKNVLRTIMKYDCLKGNIYNNIIRRTL